MTKKPDKCNICKKLIKKGVITYEGKKFCCKACCNKYKKKNVCEFC